MLFCIGAGVVLAIRDCNKDSAATTASEQKQEAEREIWIEVTQITSLLSRKESQATAQQLESLGWVQSYTGRLNPFRIIWKKLVPVSRVTDESSLAREIISPTREAVSNG